MPSSFNSLDLFSSGPHRFLPGPSGEQLIHRTARCDPDLQSGTQAVGPLDSTVLVRGRLVADSDAALWSLIEAITAALTDPPTTADLIDLHAHTYAGMSFISFIPTAPTDRGRQISLPYEARFTRFPT